MIERTKTFEVVSDREKDRLCILIHKLGVDIEVTDHKDPNAIVIRLSRAEFEEMFKAAIALMQFV